MEWLASGQAAGEPAQQLVGVQAEPLEQAAVLVGVDLVGELLVGPVSLVVLALLAEQIKDRALVELHGAPLLLWLVVGGRDASTLVSCRGVPPSGRPSGPGAAGRAARPRSSGWRAPHRRWPRSRRHEPMRWPTAGPAGRAPRPWSWPAPSSAAWS